MPSIPAVMRPTRLGRPNTRENRSAQSVNRPPKSEANISQGVSRYSDSEKTAGCRHISAMADQLPCQMCQLSDTCAATAAAISETEPPCTKARCAAIP